MIPVRSRRGAFLLAALFLLLALFAVFAILRVQNDAARWVTHGREVLLRIEATLSTLKDAETGQQGYLLTDDAPMLVPYRSALATLPATLDGLAQLTQDNAEQVRTLARVRAEIKEKLEFLEQTIALHDSGQSAAALAIVRSGRGATLMDTLRTDLAAMRAEEEQLLAQRASRASQASFWTLATMIATGALSLILLWLLRALTVRDAARLRASEERLATTVASVGDAVIATDAQGRIERMNPVAEQLTGWTLAQASGQPLARVFQIINEQTRVTVESPFDKVLREGGIVALANHTVLIAKDGTERPIEDSAAPIPGVNGAIAGIVLVFKDATERYAADRTLRESEARFRALADNIPTLCWMADEAGSIFWYNRRWYEYTGTTLAEMQGWGWQSVHDPGVLPSVMERWTGCIAAGVPFEMTFPLRAADGIFHPFLTRIVPVRDDTGAIARWFGNNVDISEQQRSEQALRESEARFRAAVAAVEGIIWTNNAAGEMTGEQPGWAALTGQSFDEYRGYGWARAVHPDDAQSTIDAWNDAVAARSHFEFEHRVRRHDGEWRRFSLRAIPIFNGQQEVTQWVGVHTDITRIREAQWELQASEERFRTLASTMPALIFMTDAQGANIYANAVFQQFTGKSAEELSGNGWLETLHPADREKAAATWAKAWHTSQSYEAEYRFHRAGDDYRCHLVRATPVRDAAGLITQWVGICSDVQDVIDARTELTHLNAELESRVEVRTAELTRALEELKAETVVRTSAEAQVRQLQKMEAVGQLTGGVAHDFNNMLAIVIGSLDQAKRRLTTDPQRALRRIETAEEGARRAAQLTARLLAFSRQQALAPEPLDANKLVAGMSELLRRTIGEDLRVETVLAGGLWRTHADPVELESAILNLCVNARDAMPGGGRMTIETANTHLDEDYARAHMEVPAGQYVLIAVTDTGTGMPPEVVERAFDPFYTTKGVGKGTGLGLSQVYGFIKQSGGHVKIYSESGQGTTVKIYLPRYFGAALGTVATDDEVEIERPHAQPGEVILVVEDETSVRHVAVDALRHLGYTVLQAADGNQALEILGTQPRVDLLFTDVVMPDMNGRQLADEAVKRVAHLKVLFMTGYTRNAVVHNGQIDPGVAFLQKPFQPSALARKIRAVLDGSGANST